MDGVFAEVEGPAGHIQDFLAALAGFAMGTASACDRRPRWPRQACIFWRGQPGCAPEGYLVMVSVSSVTAAVRASALPCTVTPVVTVIEARARMFPLKVD